MIKKGKANRADFGLGRETINMVEYPKAGISILVEDDGIDEGPLTPGETGSVFLDIVKDGKVVGTIGVDYYQPEGEEPRLDITLHDEEPSEVGDILNWPDENYFRILIRRGEKPFIK